MIWLAADHAGFSLKEKLAERLQSEGFELTTLGTTSEESCDYPDFAAELCKKIQDHPKDLGILICGTGIGMCITANKYRGIRAAVVSDEFSARMSREHNQAQVLCLGARVVDENQAFKCAFAFLKAEFDTENPRHQRRLNKIADIEQQQCSGSTQ